MSRTSLWLALTLATSAIGCEAQTTTVRRRSVQTPKRRRRAMAPPRLPGPEGLPGRVLAELPTLETEVLLARRGGDRLLVTRVLGRFLAAPLAAKAPEPAVLGPATRGFVDLAPAPRDGGPANLHAVGDGYLLLWVAPTGAGDEIRALGIDAGGKPRGEATVVARQSGAVRWVQALEREGASPLLLWETELNGASELWVLPQGAAADAAPQRLASGVRGWQAVGGKTPAVAWVAGARGRGAAQFRRIEASGKPGPVVLLDDARRALPDVQLVATAGGFEAAWTDERASDAHVYRVRLDATGKRLGQAKPAVAPVGAQALVSLVASRKGDRVLLGWERQLGAKPAERLIELSARRADGVEEGRAQLRFAGASGAPHVTPDGDGFAFVTLAPFVESGKVEPGPTVGPVHVRLDRTLGVVASEPVRVAALGEAGVPALVHRLHCDDGRCIVWATGRDKPALLVEVDLETRQNPWLSPVKRTPLRQPGPKASRLGTTAKVAAPIADVSAAQLADGRTLVAWVTHTSGEGPGLAPANATLAFTFVDADGKAGPVRTLSEKAISIAGVKAVALPPTTGKKKRGRKVAVAALAWAGPHAGASQMYMTLLDAEGGKVRQSTVTKIGRPRRKSKKSAAVPNQVFDVDAVVDPSGQLVCAWSDTRDRNPEIYVARMNAQLQKNVLDVRVTKTSGASTEARLAVLGGRTMLVWSEGKADPKKGGADVFAQALETKSLRPVGKPRRLLASKPHSRTPQVVAAGEGRALVHWIEDATTTGGASAARAVTLDESGATITAVREVLARGATVSAFTSCKEAACRWVSATTRPGITDFDGLAFPAASGAPLGVHPITSLRGGAAQDLGVVGVAASGAVFFVEDGGARGSRIRRLALRW